MNISALKESGCPRFPKPQSTKALQIYTQQNYTTLMDRQSYPLLN